MNKHFVFAAFCAALLVQHATADGSDDWSQWRGPDRTGFVDTVPILDALPAKGLEPAWKLGDLPGGNSGGWSSPVISAGRVYVYAHIKNKTGELPEKKFPWLSPDKRVGMSDQEYKEYEIKRRAEDEQRAKAYRFEQRMMCLDLDSGETIWDQRTPAAYTRFVQSGTPCVVDEKVFVLGPERTAYCYNASTGEVIWRQRLPGEFRDEFFASSFVVSGNVALVACGPLYALRASDGQILWSGEEKATYSSHSSPAIWKSNRGEVAICNTSGGRTQAYRISDGELIWEIQSGVGQSSPVISGNLLLTYGASRKSGLSAYELNLDEPQKTPQMRWQFRGAADSGSCPVVRDGHVFVQGEKRLAKVRLEDGKRIWQSTMRISTPRYSSLIAAGDQVIYGWEGILSFDANADRYQQNYDAEIDSDSVLIDGDDLRTKLGLAEIERGEGGLAKAESLWQRNAVKSGPLRCSTPALSDGRLVVRLNQALVCYDLRKSP